MCDIPAILNRARSLGLTLRIKGDRIAIAPARRCPSDLLAAVRDNKPAVMSLLEARAAKLSPDCAPWVHVARQVISGEFSGADRSTVNSLKIGLRSIAHPLCRRALEQLGAKVH